MRCAPVISFLLLTLFCFSFRQVGQSEVCTQGQNSYVPKSVAELQEELIAKGLSAACIEMAFAGHAGLCNSGELKNDRYLTIVDMSRSANTERFFIVDLLTNQLVHKSLVAHGKNTGNEFATSFSNTSGSYQTSLGFYVTAETYYGRHGLAMRLDGLEPSNDKARERDIVVHSADYVSQYFIQKNNRLGRSWGCPALPEEHYEEVIELIKEGACMFIYHPTKRYIAHSYLLAEALSTNP